MLFYAIIKDKSTDPKYFDFLAYHENFQWVSELTPTCLTRSDKWAKGFLEEIKHRENDKIDLTLQTYTIEEA